MKKVYLSNTLTYDPLDIAISLPTALFEPVRNAGIVVLKPNWVSESHGSKPGEWDYVITHPAVITGVIIKILMVGRKLREIVITDGPQTDSSFSKIMQHYPVDQWEYMTAATGIKLKIIDLRDDEWKTRKGVVLKRKKLPGDPAGKSLFNIPDRFSAFHGKEKSARGYYGADYNTAEVNDAHNGTDNLYSVSKTVMEADVFINLPKLKTHKKAGITCSLKNLVGINTYKNFLPHHSEGAPTEGGDQFPARNVNSVIEGPVMARLKQKMAKNDNIAKLLAPLKRLGESIFGKTGSTIRSGNWHGNDTLWRTILDLNKILLYGNPDGTFREPAESAMKPYITVVDGILAGQGNGPLEPDPVNFGRIICGSNPVAVDMVCASLMGFDPDKIPAIRNAFNTGEYPLVNFSKEEILVETDDHQYPLSAIPENLIMKFIPHFGWQGQIEKEA